MPFQGRRNGFYLTQHPNGRLFERETFGCGHCQHVTIIPHGAILDDLGRMCLKCMRPICQQCSALAQTGAPHETWEERFDKIEALARGQMVERHWQTDLEMRIEALRRRDEIGRDDFHQRREDNETAARAINAQRQAEQRERQQQH